MSKKKNDSAKKHTLADERPPTFLDKMKKKTATNNSEKKNSKRVKVTAEDREKLYKKPPLAKLYDRMVPGDYTMSQDKHHTIFLFSIIVVILILVSVIIFFNVEKEKYSTSSMLTIPATTFVQGQENNVYEILEGYGFKNIRKDSDGNIVADGTPERVNAYQNSFYEKNVQPARELMNKDYMNIGIDKIELSNDGNVLKIYTGGRVDTDSTLMSSLVKNNDVDTIIQAYAAWSRMKHGAPLTVKFYDVTDTSGGIDGTAYYSTSTSASGSQIVAEIEAAEYEQASNQSEQTNSSEENAE